MKTKYLFVATLSVFFIFLHSFAEAQLSPPTLTATAISSSQIDLSWYDPNRRESGLGIQRLNPSTGQYQTIATVAKRTSSFSDTGLNAGTTYSYRLMPFFRNGEYVYSNIAIATTFGGADTTPPTVSITSPASGTTYTLAQTVTINASASDNVGVTKVDFYDGTALKGTDTSSPYSFSWFFASADNGTHNWAAKAYDSAGNISVSSIVSLIVNIPASDITPPSVPTGLTATAASCSQINLSWNESTDTGGLGLAGYKVYRGTSQIGTTTATTYSDYTLTTNTQYCYKVAAYDGAGNISAQSTQACATTPACSTTPPAVPTGLTATAVSSSQINLTWQDNANNENGFHIWRYHSSVGWAEIAVVVANSTSYQDTGLSASTTYMYTVRAYNSAGVSGWSNVTSATTLSGGGNNCPIENPKCQMVAAYLSAVSIENDYLNVVVDDVNSRFSFGNTGGDAANLNDNNQTLLFAHPYPGTSFTTVRIDGEDFIFGSSDGIFSQNATSYPKYIKSVWKSHNIQVTQTLDFVPNLNTRRLDTVRIRYMLENVDLMNSHTVGLRILLDTMLAGNDGASFYIPGTGAITTEYEYSIPMPDYWVAVDDLGNPSVVSKGAIKGFQAATPTRVIFASWPDVAETLWDYTVTPGKTFGSASYPDSSVGVYWDPVILGPGERIEYVTSYGLSDLTQSLMTPLTLSVASPLNLDIVEGIYSPNPFVITASLENVSYDAINDVSISIDLPIGLNLEPGSPTTHTISTLIPNQPVSLDWSVRADDQTSPALFSYVVSASAAGLSERTVSRSLLVPFLSLAYDTPFKSIPNGYQFSNFSVISLSWDLFRDTFGADEVEINGQHSPSAQYFYDNFYSTAASKGSCFGMAASSLVLFQNLLDGWDLGLNPDNALPSWPIFPNFLSTPTDWVEYYHGRQFVIPFDAVKVGPIDVYHELKQRMASGYWIQDPMVMKLYFKGGGSHTVTPYGIEESADHRLGKIFIYDNSYPGQQYFVDIDLDSGAVIWHGMPNYVTSIIANSLFGIQNAPQIPIYDAVTSSGHLLFTDSVGRHLGYYNGEFTNEIPDAYKVQFLYERDGNLFPETYRISNLNLKRELIGAADGIATISIARANSLIIADVQVTPTSVDELSVAVDASSVEFISEYGTPFVSLTLDKETSEIARVARVEGFGVESGSKVQLRFSNDHNAAEFINHGEKKHCKFYLEQIGTNPGKYTSPVPVEIEENSSISTTPHNWSDLARTYIEIDQDIGNDGTIDNVRILTELQVDIGPNTLNIGSEGQYVTMYIQLPSGYDVRNVDTTSIKIMTVQGDKLDAPIGTTGHPISVGDDNYDGIEDLMVKFKREELTNILPVGLCEIGVIGKLLDETYFSTTDVIKVLN